MEYDDVTKKSRDEMLRSALSGRVHEVMYYQINIDNYSIALREIAALPAEEQAELAEFREQLNALLKTEKLEQKKAKIMLKVVQQQIEV